ncbi:hypothetical protein EMPS_03739 [Entomortierella parvispora]|uniref:Uncharacterized protein n=1 Tax=Entomortierella parvispora TaxID=205924 RepID=A0A9P3H7B3_9FUNG|nr:hypothetical protein EMPS_03739 [Entomortierella parvispora]
MDNPQALPGGSMEKAISLPEVLACIFSWLRDERQTMRSLRLVSKQFMAAANQFFRIHLTADYAIEHNCIQEAPSIIGGLTLTFPRIITEEADKLSRRLGLEPQDNIVSLDFCSTVARKCTRLEKVKIALEGPQSEEISQLLSCLFSQNPQTAAVFRIKTLEFIFGFKFIESVLPDIRNNLPDSCTGLLSTSDYTPTKSPFSGLERLKLNKRYSVEVPPLYRVLQLKICPEIAAATSFLGPVYWNRMEREARLSTASSIAKPSMTLRVFDIGNSLVDVGALYELKEQAPMLEEVSALTVCDKSDAAMDDEAFLRNSARPPQSLRLKKLSLLTTEDRQAKQLLFRLLDPSILESYVSNFIYDHRNSRPARGNLIASSRILNEIMDGLHVDPISGNIQEGFFREFGFSSHDSAMERVDWLQELQSNPRLHRLERLCLPLTVNSFLEIFDSPTPPSTITLESNMNPTMTMTTTATPATTEGKEEPPKQPLLPFPACSSLHSLRLGGYGTNEKVKGGQRFADYLTRNLSRLKHLDINTGSFVDFTFFNAIAPPAIQPPANPIPPSLSQVNDQMDLGDGAHNQETDHHRHRNNINHENSGLYRLESLTMSLEYVSQSEFDGLPKSERVMELLERRDEILDRHPTFGSEDEEYGDYQAIENELQMERQRMLLEARPIQIHEDLIEQFLSTLSRFQRRKASWSIDEEAGFVDPGAGPGGVQVEGLKQVTLHLKGMPEVFVEKLKALVTLQFPELDFKLSSGIHHIERQ